MKILAISAGSIGGNTELVLLEALKAAKAEAPDASIQLVRLKEAQIGKHFLAGQKAHPFSNRSNPGPEDGVMDDRPFILELIMESDAILLGSPVYTRAASGLLKWFQDNTLGPFQDVSAAAAMLKQGKADSVDMRVFKPRVAALVCVGGAISLDWTPFGLPLMHQVVFPMAIKTVDQMQVHGAGLPGCVILDEKAMSRAAELGRNLASQANKPESERAYVGPTGSCPVCHLDVIVLRGGNKVECATCGAKGVAVVKGANIELEFTPDGLNQSVKHINGLDIHGVEIMEVAKKILPHMGSIPEKTKYLRELALETLVKLPSSTTTH